MKGEAKSGDVALAGKDGKRVRELLEVSQTKGVQTLARLCAEAVPHVADSIARGIRVGRLFNSQQLDSLANSLAATNATADLLGRSRVRERQQKAEAAGGLHKLADEQPFERFDDPAAVQPLAPVQAIDFFRGLTPTIGVDPRAFADGHERTAFTLAVNTDTVLLGKVKSVILEALQAGTPAAIAANDIQTLLERMGVAPANPQYSEMVFRTNAMDAYNTGATREMRDPDVADSFPVWQYLAIVDERTGDDHRPHAGRYYPNEADFGDVRGSRVFNCRCTFRPVDRFEWAELQKAGAQVETTW